MSDNQIALIVGAGSGLSASLARLFAGEGMSVALAARDAGKLDELAGACGARVYGCDAGRPQEVRALFKDLAADLGPPDVEALRVTCYGGFLVGQAAAKAMLARGSGSILFTGASASVKGYARSASFAMGKFALRGLAQSMARELAPQNIHVAHFVIDGSIGSAGATGTGQQPDSQLDPDAIARTYLGVHRQHRSAWTWEVELRPWVESF
jgi:NAD(P)-dependent dehydrogenase (short-subunit alcohol dehydrogenase family)